MIDIHAHLLPGVDDGPTSWEEAIEMIQEGVNDGIEGVICTSHVLDCLDRALERELITKFQQLKRIVKQQKIKIKIWLGSEIHFLAHFDYKSKIATLNGTGKYVLLELPLAEIPNDVGDKIFELTLEGVTPILAHPERNAIILRRPRLAYEFVQRGALLQLNAGSITGRFGKHVKKISYTMLDHQMVHFVASDCHGFNSRPMVLSRAYRVVSHRWGEETAENLFRLNPGAVVLGEPITQKIPISFKEHKRRSHRFFKLGVFNR